MSTIRASVVVATSGPVAKYGGIQLAPEALESIAAALNRGDIPMTWNHDPRQRIAPANVVARVEEIGNGLLGVVLEFDVEQDAWEQIQSRFAEAGVPGGFSFTSVVPVTELGAEMPDRILVAAEDGEFADSDVIEAVAPLTRYARIEVGNLFQFSALEQVARVIIELGPAVVAALGPELAGAALYDAIRHLLRRKRRRGNTMVDLRILDDGGVRRTQAIIVTDDPDIAASAVRDCFIQMDRLKGVVDFDVASREWRSHDD